MNVQIVQYYPNATAVNNKAPSIAIVVRTHRDGWPQIRAGVDGTSDLVVFNTQSGSVSLVQRVPQSTAPQAGCWCT